MKIIDKYAEFVSEHPARVLIGVLVISIFLFYFAMNIEQKTSNIKTFFRIITKQLAHGILWQMNLVVTNKFES
jgi:predicted RND superfamily exporter protein